ncbi:hypothetical protein Hanom_Chr03g00241881 [Helianthus anomalus]
MINIQLTYHPPIDMVLLLDNPLGDSRICKDHKTETTGTPCGVILHDHSFQNLTKTAKILL